MARRRPTAFDVSFPEEAEPMSVDPRSTSALGVAEASRSSSVASNTSLGKRKSDGLGDTRVPKRQQLPPSAVYRPKHDEKLETDQLIIDGEDPDHEGFDVQEGDGPNEKPIRELYNFFIFDPRHNNELVSLAALEQNDGVDRNFEAVGFVRPHFVSSEDDGQEDGLDEDEEEDQSGRGPGKGRGGPSGKETRKKKKDPRIQLSAILRYTVDYTSEKEYFYLETMYAWYILIKPADKYVDFYKHFYAPRRVAQLLISSALSRPKESWNNFLSRFTSRVDMFGHTYVEQDLWDSLDEIQQAVLDEPEVRSIKAVDFVKHLLRKAPTPSSNAGPPRRTQARSRHRPKGKGTIGNLDLAVLKAENQNSTHVTPRIAKLAQGLFREEIEVIGPPPPAINKAQVEDEKRKSFRILKGLYAQAKKNKKIDYNKDDRIDVNKNWYKAVTIDGVVYKIGDVVLRSQGNVFDKNAPGPQLGDRIDKFFWFGLIRWISINDRTVHLQWFSHGSQTIMGEVAHPNELFLEDSCGGVAESFHLIVGKVKVTYFPTDADVAALKPNEYFCRFKYDSEQCTFEALNQTQLQWQAELDPPENCRSCTLSHQRDLDLEAREVRENGTIIGLTFAGKDFHLEDFVLYRAAKGPCNIGYITDVKMKGKQPTSVTVRKVGRIADLAPILPKNMIKDERHLYLTLEEAKVDVDDLLDVIYAPCEQSFQAPTATRKDWVDLSHKHFYLRYVFPELKVKNWDERRRLTWKELHVCTPCCRERLAHRKLMYTFLDDMQVKPLSTLDLFGGVGAFSRGLAEGSGCLRVTHAVEIGPSASNTFRRNSPETVVYNQCANIMLRYAIKFHAKHNPTVPTDIGTNKDVLPPPKPGEIKVITAGFPCQSHSTLNMFKKADDVKSNLILTTLSYMDYYQPIYGFFENVPGFVHYHLQADRANQHGATGEIEKGGLKLLVRALIDMRYQVRFCHLQAVHYGTPQRRNRFFLIAAKEGYPLPEFPQPTHDFPDAKDITIKMHDAVRLVTINPIEPSKGVAMHPCVTIKDAIGDLPPFDWAHPSPHLEHSATKRAERKKRLKTIPAHAVLKSEKFCGLRGQVGYAHEPKTTFQKQAREEAVVDIQHYTKCLLPPKVIRVLSVPLVANADYRNLPSNLTEWSTSNPMSAAGRSNYRKGIYGRLDADGVFPTTVTNVDPTAKQCQVLHPDYYRMVTVRELARSQGFPDSFVFEAAENNIVTMHRQIGNAVPLPVGRALGRELRESLFQRWKNLRSEAIVIEDEEEEEGDEQPGPHHVQVPPATAGSRDEDDDMDIYE